MMTALHAQEMLSRLQTPGPDALVLRLKTLTPLHTGGIGQLGEQLHPSNLLGGIRHMSCLVARTLGDQAFEQDVWGNPGMGAEQAQAKQVALHWNFNGLKPKALPPEIKIARGSAQASRWWFNTAFEGELSLQVSRRGISQAHWLILTVALAVQVRHGSFGSKDQFGLGVLAPTDDTALCTALDTDFAWPPATPSAPGQLNLLRYAFGTVRLRPVVGKKPILNLNAALTVALATRVTLRNALRAQADAPTPEKDRLKQLRHLMLGSLNESGSAVNVSAAYGPDSSPQLRIAVALKPESAAERMEVMKSFNGALLKMDDLIETTGYRVADKSWEFGGSQSNRAAWLNKLAGVGL